MAGHSLLLPTDAPDTMTAGSSRLLPHRLALVAALFVVAGLILIELAMDRPPICTCGIVRFWSGDVQSAQNSQQVADWYSFSHVIHGLLFYFVAWLAWERWAFVPLATARWAFPVAVVVESAWELLENSPIIIDRYRAVTISWGYSGDSILNSAADVGWMSLGFLLAGRMPAIASVIIALAFELFTLAMVRDNLTLNIVMLIWPVDSIRLWQAGG